ncbi:MAG TPA: 2Fe-2S iron-sulfur cluster-binding protein [Actinomycetota bacterium]|nr:2Fe-2S iron-sulfur cluster-binding protein [Actinomycetota bacterium]
MGARLRLGRRRIAVEDGDTIASALYRSGIRTFSRSLKYHRRRGLFCGTGDCPNCLVTVDGVPGVRSCVTAARDGMRVRREGGWPSVERDVLSLLDRLHVLLPVGFYYKTFIRPRWAWAMADRVIRRAVGLGRLPSRPVGTSTSRHVHCDVLVVGGGSAGRAAAVSAAARGERTVLCDEGPVEDPPDGIDVLARHAAIGAYEGPMLALASREGLVQIHPTRVVVATGATEVHPVFPGNDLPGVMLGRAAAGLVTRGVEPGRRVVMAVAHDEGIEHLEALLAGGVRIAAVIMPRSLAGSVPDGVRTFVDAEVLRAEGKERVRFAVLRDAEGVTRGIGCDAFVLSVGLSPRDDLLRMSGVGEPVEAVGDAASKASPTATSRAGYVCLCEDVSVADLTRAWDEGYRSSELLKRYTTATMGPCQGAMCGRHLAAFAAARGADANAAARTTARPLARPAPLEILAAPVHEIIEKRTSLHDLHVAAGARIGWSGSWLRPFAYRNPDEEYRATRERVSVMDVGTLGKFLLTGPDARALIEASFPTPTDDPEPGRARYLLALDEAGYVFDDGLLCPLGAEGWYVTSTSGGADRMEAWLRDRVDRLSLRAHVVDLSAERGAILVAGPLSRDLLAGLTDDPIDGDALPHMGVREVTVAGVPCGAIRAGFVGELAFELHHPRSRGPELWRAIVEAGAPLGLVPHGLDALEVLRLEKGHLYVGQDTLPDDTPAKLGLEWAVHPGERFVAARALERLAAMPLDRKLAGLEFDRGGAELRGVPLRADGRIVGRVTSAARSPILDRSIGLGWIRRDPKGEFPDEFRADRVAARVVPTPFYDPEGERLGG